MSIKFGSVGITLFCIVAGLLLSRGLTVSNYEYSYHHEGFMRDHDPDRWAPEPITLRKCVPIPTGLSLCSNVGYKTMALPNLLGHDSIAEVKRQAGPWVPLNNVKCHPNTDLFLCSLYAPVCLPNMDKPIQPCRSLCESVKNNCVGHMNKYGFQWPAILRCDKFPPGDLCIKQLNFTNHTGVYMSIFYFLLPHHKLPQCCPLLNLSLPFFLIFLLSHPQHLIAFLSLSTSY